MQSVSYSGAESSYIGAGLVRDWSVRKLVREIAHHRRSRLCFSLTPVMTSDDVESASEQNDEETMQTLEMQESIDHEICAILRANEDSDVSDDSSCGGCLLAICPECFPENYESYMQKVQLIMDQLAWVVDKLTFDLIHEVFYLAQRELARTSVPSSVPSSGVGAEDQQRCSLYANMPPAEPSRFQRRPRSKHEGKMKLTAHALGKGGW